MSNRRKQRIRELAKQGIRGWIVKRRHARCAYYTGLEYPRRWSSRQRAAFVYGSRVSALATIARGEAWGGVVVLTVPKGEGP